MGQWVLGAGLTALVAFAHAQPSHAPHGGGFSRATFAHAAYHAAPRQAAGAAMHWYGGGPRGPGSYRVQAAGGYRQNAGGYRVAPMQIADQHGYGGEITPVSAEARAVPHPPADSPVRTGSIREDVARYNEERANRPFPRGPADVPRSASPYRN